MKVLLAIVSILLSALVCTASRALASTEGCVVETTAQAEGHQIGLAVWEGCDHGTPRRDDHRREPRIRTEDCGPRSSAGGFTLPTGVNCTQTLVKCRLPQGAKVEQDKHVVITQTRQTDGSWILTNTECDALVAKPRGPSGIDVLDAVRKLVPRPGVGVAPPGGVTLVNMQTLLWVDTPAARSLGTVRLLNRPVTIQVHVDRVDWRFGDGTSTATSTPGKAYTTADPCHTVTCPDYFGHVYRRTGSMQVSATVNWSGRYRVGTGPWQQIPGTATGRTSTTTLTVREARGVLVPNPSNWSDSH